MYIFLIIFFILAGFFSGMETGFISLDVYHLEQQNRGKLVLKFMKKIENIIGITLIGTNICIITISSVFTVYYIETGKVPFSKEVSNLLLTALIVIFAEIIPKVIFRDYANNLTLKGFPIIKFFYYLFSPILFLISKINSLFARVMGIKGESTKFAYSKEDITLFIKDDSSNQSFSQKKMITEALEFKDIEVKKIMTPRIDIVAFEEETPIKQIVSIAQKKGYTRFPIYKGDIDNIVGIFILHDILKYKEEKKVKQVKREILFVPESIDINNLLGRMKKRKRSMAIVVDSYGGTSGLVTTEDIIEELFGEIEDEYDLAGAFDTKLLKNGDILVKGYVETEVLNQKYSLNLPVSKNYNTIAGFYIEKVERIPAIGENIVVKGWRLSVIDATKRKIKRLKLHKISGLKKI